MHEQSVERLKTAVTDELTAIHQYLYFHFHCDDQGYDLLAALFKRTATEEMGHVERLADRIRFLKGDVDMRAGGAVRPVRDVRAMLQMAGEMEQESIRTYNQWAMECAAGADAVSRQLLESLVADEERHYAQYTTELENLEKFGEHYLVLQSIERSKHAAVGPGKG
jgi:bacterioferritin